MVAGGGGAVTGSVIAGAGAVVGGAVVGGGKTGAWTVGGGVGLLGGGTGAACAIGPGGLPEVEVLRGPLVVGGVATRSPGASVVGMTFEVEEASGIG